MAKTINSRIPEGPVAEKWTNYKAHQRLVNPKNKLKLDIIVVGTGLAGASAAASLGEMGFHVLNFCIQDSPRRAHSIAAQGGINAAKNYQNDGDSVYRLFYDTVKGGDYRAREANVYRLAEVSNDIIDQCVAQGVPFARAGQPLVWWCPGVTYLLCQGPDRPAAVARRLLFTEPPGQHRPRHPLYPLRDGRPRDHRRPCSWYHCQEPRDRRVGTLLRQCRGYRHWRRW